MLREIDSVRQRPEEGARRWFRDDEFDLIVWYAHDGDLLGFQLCYDKQGVERALTWKTDGTFTHDRVDSGDTVFGGMKKTAMLVADGDADTEAIAERFLAAAGEIDPEIVDLVRSRVLRFPEP